jgi:hypothetical protein
MAFYPIHIDMLSMAPKIYVGLLGNLPNYYLTGLYYHRYQLSEPRVENAEPSNSSPVLNLKICWGNSSKVTRSSIFPFQFELLK